MDSPGACVTLRVNGLSTAAGFQSLRTIRRIAVLALTSVMLVACGGGGGGSDSANLSPTASFTATPASGAAPLVVAFNAAASSDSDGSITRYAWNFGDGGTTSSTGSTASRTYGSAGTYTVTLTVTDNRGATASTTRTVQVDAPNQPPIAAFEFAPTGGAAPLTIVFDGSPSTDPEGPIATYTWNFGDGTGTSTGSTLSHTFATAGTFIVQLTVADARGLTASTTQSITISGGGGPSSVTVSGKATYERVPFSSNVNLGLSYANASAQPIREAVVELIQSGGSTLATTTTDDNGNYSLTAPANTSVFVRVQAQARRTNTPARTIRVRNNTNGNALYVLDGSVFNSGTTSQTKNLFAGSGWGGTSYSGLRSAAPFAILDTMLSAARFVVDNGNSMLDLPALDVYWSPLNNSASGDVTLGQIESTLFTTDGPAPGIYVLGDENVDTDEYDQHVLAHEFQHFLEYSISRSESPGGPHSPNDRLDLRVAFSEGFANAFSAMVLGDPLYSDSLGSQQGRRFSFSMESNATSPAGWYNEASIQSVTWDLFDAAIDGVDSVALGYKPLYEALTGRFRTGPALTSVYPFVIDLKGQAGAPVAAINALVTSQSIHGTDEWGTNETNDGSVQQALPLYARLTLNGGAKSVCGTTSVGTYNKIGNRSFLRFSITSARAVTVRAQYTSTGSTAPLDPDPDPDIVLYNNGFLDIAESTAIGDESLTRTLEPGEYVIEVYEWSHLDPTYSAAERRGDTCFNVSVTG
jgi:PKD repeat protein